MKDAAADMTSKESAKAAEPMKNGPGTLRKIRTRLSAKAAEPKFMKFEDIAMSAEEKTKPLSKAEANIARNAETLLKTGLAQAAEELPIFLNQGI